MTLAVRLSYETIRWIIEPPMMMIPRLFGRTAQRRDERDKLGFATVSDSLEEAVDELLIAAQQGAGAYWLGVCEAEIRRHVFIKDAALAALLGRLAGTDWTTGHKSCAEDLVEACSACKLHDYATATMSVNSASHLDKFLEAARVAAEHYAEMRSAASKREMGLAEKSNADGVDT